jgi:hypothetical protein
METEAARQLQAARESGEPDFLTTPTRVESTGLVIPSIYSEPQRRLWRLQEDWIHETLQWTFTVPAGWETDLATVPGPLRNAVNSFEFGITGPLLHDFLYAHGGSPPEGTCRPWHRFTRREVDHLFRELMQKEKVPTWRRNLGYAVVRALGWTHWDA